MVPEQNKLFGVPGGCNGRVYAMAKAPSGVLYLGGDFVICEDVLASQVVAYDPRTRQFFALGSGAANGVDGGSFGAVYALAMVGNDLYVAGQFDQAGGQPANNIARWDGIRWSTLGNAETNGVFGAVFDLAVMGSDLFVAGYFESAGGVIANGVAKWSASAWVPLGSGVAGVPDARVFAVEISAGDVYIGGDFLEAGGQAASYLARWNGVAWSALGSGGAQGTNAIVNALVADGSELFVGGNFSQAGGQPAAAIARWDGSAFRLLGTATANGVDSQVTALAVVSDDLYVGGVFNAAGGVPAQNIARWNGSEWSALGAGTSSTVWAIEDVGADLFVGGDFDRSGAIAANFIARWDGSGWFALGGGVGNGVNDVVRALAVVGNDLYAGGQFSQAGGQDASRIARWNGSRWSTLGDGDENGVNSSVLALAVRGSDVFIGGRFDRAGGMPANLIVRWDGSTFSTLGTGLGGNFASVQAIQVVGSDLYVGGEFTEAGGQPANKIARWNGSNWSALGSGAANGVSRGDFIGVESIAVAGTDVYVGGGFTEAGGQPARFVARWNGTAWSSLGSGSSNGVNGPVPALAIMGNDLYAGGAFSEAGGRPVNAIARWNGSDWSALGSEETNGVNGAVYALTVVGSDLYAAGSFSRAGGEIANGLARWDGARWHGLNADAPPQVIRALVADGSSLYAGGAGLTQTPLPDLQSKTQNGAVGNAASTSIVVSGNGTVLAFASDASNLVAGDGNGRRDIFLRDRILETTKRISASAEAVNGGVSESFSEPALSADGRRIAFSGSSGQVYVAIDEVGRVLSSNALGTPGNAPSGRPFLAGNGLAFFDSQASNLLTEVDGNGPVADIYLKNLDTGAVQLISRTPGGAAANGASRGPWAAADGQTIVFESFATNIVMPAASTKGSVAQATMMRGGGFGQTRFYLSRNLATGQLGNGDSTEVRVTPDGRFGVFQSLASNLVDGDTNGVSDIFRFEISNNVLSRLQRVSVSRHGFQGDGASTNPSISDDGQFVTFETAARNLVELDRNSTSDILVKWLETGEVLRLSRTVDDQQPNGPSGQPRISGDGSSIVFASGASNLSAGDSNQTQDVFAVSLRGSGAINPTGAWYDPAQDGHGLQLQLLAGNRVLAFWYTFDPSGRPAYFIGDGPFNGTSATLTNLRPVGSFFPPDFNPAQISIQPFGSMQVSFESCTLGVVNYVLPQGFGEGSMRLTRLTQPAGVLCGATTPTTTANPRMSAASGAWYNPQQDGQGFVVESLGGGLLLANWYTQAPSPAGGQSWIIGVGTITGNQATMEMILVDGGRFIPAFNAANITRQVLGNLVFRLDSCDAGQVSWTFSGSYGSGTMPIQRLTAPAGVICVP